MDKLSELSHGAKVVLGAAIAFLVFSFLNWYKVDLGPLGSAGESMWHGVGFIAGLLVIAIIVWQAVRLANINIEVGVTPAMITAALSVLLLIFTFIRFIDKPGGSLASDVVDRTVWAWLGLILAIVIVVGAWLNMQAAGEGLGDIRSRVESMTGSGGGGGGAAAAAPPAEPTPAPPAAPAAPAEPAETAAPAPEAPAEGGEGDETRQA
jgi:hypothetical protein